MIFVVMLSKVRKLVRMNRFQVESTKMGTGRKFVTFQYLLEEQNITNAWWTGTSTNRATRRRRELVLEQRRTGRALQDSVDASCLAFAACIPWRPARSALDVCRGS